MAARGCPRRRPASLEVDLALHDECDDRSKQRDAFNERVYVFSHPTKDATVIDAKDGTVLGRIDLGGVPEEGVADGKGLLYVVMQDPQGSVTVALLDLDLPGMSGPDTLRAIRAMSPAPEVVVTAARGTVTAAADAARHGQHRQSETPPWHYRKSSSAWWFVR